MGKNPYYGSQAIKNSTAHRANDNGQPFTFEEHIELFGGFIRFGIPLNAGLEIFPWEGGKLADEARIPPDERTRLEKTAKQRGANPDEWYGILENVPVSSCASIQELDVEKYEKEDKKEWIDIRETIKR